MEPVSFETLLNEVTKPFAGREMIAYTDGGGQRRILTAESFIARTVELSEMLARIQCEARGKKRMGICVKNSHDWLALLFAVVKTGNEAVLLNDEWSAEQINAYIASAGIYVLLDDNPKRANEIECENVLLFPELCFVKGQAGNAIPQERPNWASSIAFVTSGTTERPRVYSMSAGALVKQTLAISGNNHFLSSYHASEIAGFMQVLPLRHCFGLGTMLAFLKIGFTAVFPADLGVLTMIRTVRRERIGLLAAVPALWKAFFTVVRTKTGRKEIETSTFAEVFGDSLKTGVCAGARTDEALIRDFLRIPVHMLNGWGMTETGIIMLGAYGDSRDAGYTGRVIPGIGCETGILCDDGEVCHEGTGELLIRTDGIASGVSLMKENENPRSEWFRTGDIFEKKDECFFFRGRCKSVIIDDSGENIYPEEVEEHFASVVPEWVRFCIVGEENLLAAYFGNVKGGLQACKDFDAASAVRSINAALSPSKRVSVVYVTEDDLPVTAKGETARFVLEQFKNDSPESFEKIIIRKGKIKND